MTQIVQSHCPSQSSWSPQKGRVLAHFKFTRKSCPVVTYNCLPKYLTNQPNHARTLYLGALSTLLKNEKQLSG